MTTQINQRTNIKLTPYLATGLAEGFEEGTAEQQVEAWAYLISTGMAWTLQGWFGRAASQLIASGLISQDGTIDWDEYDSRVE